MKEEGIVENAARIGEDVLGPGLRDLADRHPVIGEVRGLGVFWALDLVTDRATREPLAPYGGTTPAMNELVGECKKRGLLPFTNFNRLHVVPPCTVTDAEVQGGPRDPRRGLRGRRPALHRGVSAAQRTVLRPGRVLDIDTGELLDRVVVIADGVIEAVLARRRSRGPDERRRACVDLPDLTVLPGLIDCHAHLIGEPDGAGRLRARSSSAAVRRRRCPASATPGATLRAGFTTVRDVGTFRAFVDVALRDAIDAGWVEGPRMYVSGAYITCSGGGGDVTGMAPDIDAVLPARPAGRRRRLGRRGPQGRPARAARRCRPHQGHRHRRGDGRGHRRPGHRSSPRPRSERPSRRPRCYGVDVAAHAHGAEGIKRAVRAGVRSIEHGSIMDDEGVELMAERGTYLVADVYCGDYIAETGRAEGWSAEVLRKNDETTETQREAFAKCVKAGVPIAFGTDSGIYPHGLNARQFAYQVRHGQTPLEAIRSATVRRGRRCSARRTRSAGSPRATPPTSSEWSATRRTTYGCWRTWPSS